MKILRAFQAGLLVCIGLELIGGQPAAAQSVAASGPIAATASEESSSLTLDQSIELALHLHGSTRSASRAFLAANQSIQVARSGLFPQVIAGYNYNYVNQNNSSRVVTDPTTGVTRTTNSNGGTTTTDVAVSQNVFDSGRVRAKVKQAEAGAVNAAGGYGNARNALAYEVAQRFYEQLRQTRLVTQRESQVALAQSQLDLVQAQFKAGAVARSDIQSVQVNLSQARLDLSTAHNDLRVAQTNFRNSLGLDRGPALPLKDELPAVTNPAPVDINVLTTPTQPIPTLPLVPDTVPERNEPELATLEGAISVANRLRPDILQANSAVTSNEAAVKLARINNDPQVTATAGYSVDPRSSGTRGFTFAAGLSVPIFDGGGLRAAVRSAQDQLDAARILLSQTQKDAAADVETAFVDKAGQAERLKNATALFEQATVNLQNATAKYRAGAGIVLDIVNAQTQLFNAQNSYTGILYDREISRLNLDRAVGRFAWADPGDPLPVGAPASAAAASDTVSHLSAAPIVPAAVTRTSTVTQTTTTPSTVNHTQP